MLYVPVNNFFSHAGSFLLSSSLIRIFPVLSTKNCHSLGNIAFFAGGGGGGGGGGGELQLRSGLWLNQ